MNTEMKMNTAGFTLLELLIALALGLIVLTAVLGVFNSSTLSYNVQEDVAAMQQDVRVSKMFVERDIRMAGAGLAGYPLVGSLTADDLQPFVVENNLGENNSDRITISYVIPTPDECGDPPPSTTLPSCSSLPDLIVSDDMPENSAQARIVQTTPVSSWDDGCYCEGVEYPSPAFGFEFLIETPPGTPPEDRTADIAILTQVQANNNNMIQNRPIRINGIRIPNVIVNEYPAGSIIRFFSLQPLLRVQYFVNEDNILMRKEDVFENQAWTDNAPQPIAEHIEDLQFAFGLDTDDDGEINADGWRWSDAEGHFEGDGDLSDDDKSLVRTVRISVLGRTNQDREELGPEIRPALEDHAASEDPDYFRRRLSQTMVELRNIEILMNAN